MDPKYIQRFHEINELGAPVKESSRICTHWKQVSFSSEVLIA